MADDNLFGDLAGEPKAAKAPPQQANMFADLASAKPPEPEDTGLLGAATAGFQQAGRGLYQTGQTAVGSKPKDQATPNIVAAQPMTWSDFLHPTAAAEKTLYALTEGSPTFAAFALGSLAGGGPEEPLGLASGAISAGGMAFAQSLGPRFARALKEMPDNPDGAFDRALGEAGTEGVVGAIGQAAFAITPFKGFVKNLLFQAMGMQPAIGAAGKVAENALDQKPLGEGVAEGIPGSVIGTAVPAAGMHLAKGLAGARPPEAPVTPPPPADPPLREPPVSDRGPVPPGWRGNPPPVLDPPPGGWRGGMGPIPDDVPPPKPPPTQEVLPPERDMRPGETEGKFNTRMADFDRWRHDNRYDTDNSPTGFYQQQRLFLMDQTRQDGFEHASIYDANSEAVRAVGTSLSNKAVQMPLSAGWFDPKNEWTLHHTHPDFGSPLSGQDVSLLGNAGLHWIVAHGVKNEAVSAARLTPAARDLFAFAKSPESQMLIRETLGDVFTEVAESTRRAFMGAITRGKYTEAQGSGYWLEATHRALARTGLTDYVTTHDFPKHDQFLQTLAVAANKAAIESVHNRFPELTDVPHNTAVTDSPDGAMARILDRDARLASNRSGSEDGRAPSAAAPGRILPTVETGPAETLGGSDRPGVGRLLGAAAQKGVEDTASNQIKKANAEFMKAAPGKAAADLSTQARGLGARATTEKMDDLVKAAAGGGGGGGMPPLGPPPPPPRPTPPQRPSGVRGTLQSIGDRFSQRYKELFQPELLSDAAFRADPAFAKYAATKSQRRDAIIHESMRSMDYWNSKPENERIEFMNLVEGAGAHTDANGHVQFANVPANYPHMAQLERARRLLDEAHFAENTYGSKAGWIEDYFPHLWEQPQKAGQWAQMRGTAMGSTWFQKPRVFDYIQEGLDAGLKLRSTNPEQLIQYRLLSGADMRSKMELLDDLNKQQLAFPVKELPNGPPANGWFAANTPNRSQWVIRDDLGPLWKNAVDAKGLWANEGLTGDAFRGWMAFKNLWVPIRLGLSLFHPVHILHINFSNSMQRAITSLKAGDVGSMTSDIADAFNFRGGQIGRDARAAWLKDEKDMTPSEQTLVKMMQEGGFVPQLSEELRINARNSWRDAVANQSWLKMVPAGVRRAIEVTQAPIFEKWIPNLKAAAYMNEAKEYLGRHPDLADDPVRRGIALRQIGKEIDNRFGEMNYGTLFWDRTLKDAGIGSFLSLSWNLGFLREFGGGLAMDPATRALKRNPTADGALARDARTRGTFALVYTGTAMAIAGAMTQMMTGKPPSEWMDYVLPKMGGKNPDGTDKRGSTPFFTREGPQLAKHIEAADSWFWGATDMLWNKMLLQPLKEVYTNHDYWGYDIADVNAPMMTQAAQYAKWLAKEQFDPITIAQTDRLKQTGATNAQYVLSFMGFGPAPAYAARSAVQNRIEHLYALHVAPASRPHDQEAVMQMKREINSQMQQAVRDGDNVKMQQVLDQAAKSGMNLKSFKQMNIPGDIVLFRALPADDQKAILRDSTADERKRYLPFAHKPARFDAQPQPSTGATNMFQNLLGPASPP